MKDSLVPPPGTGGIFRVFSNHIQQGLNDSQRLWLCVLRHEQHMGTPLLSDLMNKLGETFTLAQTQHRIGLAAMPVATPDNRLVPAFGKVQRSLVLLPAAQARQLESVNKHP